MGRQRSPGRVGWRITKDVVHAGEYAVVMRPHLWRADQTTPMVVYAGGYSAGAMNMLGFFVCHELAGRGFLVVAGDLGDTPSKLGGTAATGDGGPGVWANDGTQTRIAELIAYGKDTLKARDTKVGLLGGSQGAGAVVRYAHDNPGDAACVLSAIGALDTEDIRVNNRNGYAASVAAAVGNPVPSAKNPATCAATWPQTVPMRGYYSTDDTICVLATQQAFGAAGGAAVEMVSFGAHGHTLAGFDAAGAADWVEGHLNPLVSA